MNIMLNKIPIKASIKIINSINIADIHYFPLRMFHVVVITTPSNCPQSLK